MFTAPHGGGKTHILETVKDAYLSTVPVALIDLAPSQHLDAGHAPVLGRAASQGECVVDALYHLMVGLASANVSFRRLRFPRLVPGLVAALSVRMPAPTDDPDWRLLEQRAASLMSAFSRRGPRDWLPGHEPELTDVEWPEDVARVLVRALLGKAAPSRFLQLPRTRRPSALDWYSRRFSLDDGYLALADLVKQYHEAETRRRAESTLLAAFFDDLADHYEKIRGPGPLVLLDNADTALGEDLLDLVFSVREERREALPDPLVILATARHGDLRSLHGRGRQSVRVEPVPPLSYADVVAVLGESRRVHVPGGNLAAIPQAIHRVTQGNPYGVRVLCEAVARSDEQPVAHRLLSLSVSDGLSSAEQLLARLVPGRGTGELLTLLSAARDEPAARALAEWRYKGIGGDRYADALEVHRLGESSRPLGATGLFADPFLHTLLIHELRRRCADEESRHWNWAGIHTFLRDHYRTRGDDASVPAELHHSLALGETTDVVRQLTDRFRAGTVAQWLRELRQVACAPHPPSVEDIRQAVAGGECDSSTGGDDLARTVGRLLHALWRALDLEAGPPDTELIDGVAADLERLAQVHPQDLPLLRHAAKRWPEALCTVRPLGFDLLSP
ncbi:hypothetical protein JHN63_39025 [Streptomyces sp. MBT65]|nr:hypothetical protein [Streptomyces sp. MBT65]